MPSSVLRPPAGVLARHQTEPGRQLAGTLEVGDISNRAQQCAGREWPDARNLGQTLAQLAAAVPQHNVALKQLDLIIQMQHLSEQALDQLGKCSRDERVFEQNRYALAQGTQALGHDQPELGEFPADLVAVGGAVFDEALAHPVQGQQRLLLNRLDRHKAHIGSGGRVLVTLGSKLLGVKCASGRASWKAVAQARYLLLQLKEMALFKDTTWL